MSRKKEEEEKSPKTIELPFGTIERIYGSEPGGRGRRDELDRVLDDEDRNLAKQAKRLEVQTIIAQRKRELARATGESPEGESVSSLEMLFGFLDNQGIKGEDAASFIKSLDQETVMKMNSLSGSQQGQNALLPLLAFSRQNPQLTSVDIAKLTSAYIEDAMKLADRLNPTRSGQPNDAFMALFSKTIDKMDEMSKSMYQNQFAEINKKLESSTKPEDYLDKVIKTAEALGFQRDHSGTQNLRVAEIEANTTLKIEEMHQQRELAMLNQQTEMNKWNAIGQIVTPLLAVGAGPISDSLRNLGRKTGQEMKVGQPQPAQGGPSITFPCKKCGGGIGPFQNPLPPEETVIRCPSCGFESTFKEVIHPPLGQGQEQESQPQGSQPSAEQPSEPVTAKAKLKAKWVNERNRV